MAASAPLLSVEELSVDVVDPDGAVRLVDRVSFAIAPGAVMGLVGESGCGKSVTAMSLLRLLPEPPIRPSAVSARFEGEELLRLDRRALRHLRGGRVGVIFQEPMTSLNPTFTIGWQLAEALRLHTELPRDAIREHAVEALRRVGIGAPERRLEQYPHELSGGLRQRVMIAMALACGPRLLIADEPTTALDVTVQLQILELIDRLRREEGMAVLLITHDLGVIAEYADQVAVMYAGRIVETAPASRLFAQPRHPYTGGLLAARPSLHGPKRRLATIPGAVPSPRARPKGCAFAPRCPNALASCAEEPPPLAAQADGRHLACWNPLP